MKYQIVVIITNFFFNYVVQRKGGKAINWRYILDLYKMATATTGVTTLPKLKYEHVYLNSFSKMRVDLAAQVCANFVVHAVINSYNIFCA